MAKKKVTHNANHKDQPTQQPQQQTQQSKPMEDPSEKLANLKSLNSMLLRETFERRQLVDTLQESNRNLESELARSAMERERLIADMAWASEECVELEVERDLVGVFLASQINGFREGFDGFVKNHVDEVGRLREERDGLVRKEGQREKRMSDLQREVRELCREREEIERVKKEGDVENRLLKKRVDELMGDLESERNVLRSVSLEKDSAKHFLDVHIEEANGLRLKLLERHKSETKIRQELLDLKRKFERLTEEKEGKERIIKSLGSDKSSVEKSLAESLQVIEGLKVEIQEIVRDKKRIEEVRDKLEMRMSELRKELGQRNEVIALLRKEEFGLGEKILALEKCSAEATEREKLLEKKINVLVEENEGKQRNIWALMEEKELIMRHLEESLNQLKNQKLRLEVIVQEKSEIKEVKSQLEGNNIELLRKLDDLKNTVSVLQDLHTDRENLISRLSKEVECFKNAADQVVLEKDDALKSLDEEKRNGMVLNSQVLELKKHIEETLKKLQQMKDRHGKEKKKLEGCNEKLIKEKNGVEKNLVEARKQIDDMRIKMESAGINAERSLTMLKNTAAVLCQTKDEEDGKKVSFVDEKKIEEEIQPYLAELEAIKKVFKNRVAKAEEMKRQLKLLQNSEANARKQKNFWTLLSSVTTIFAAASVAYVVKGS
ncbi:uncharacterized protein LOC131152917 [Malania oleifera]|uniref:uncharacterized protein LOC131152917 n=1 Tax=Malania oleifera TaxID=397392 RepID=UPI0025AEB2F7|nr:uncharacterized protein LOC131152917 [Malania oleifera]